MAACVSTPRGGLTRLLRATQLPSATTGPHVYYIHTTAPCTSQWTCTHPPKNCPFPWES